MAKRQIGYYDIHPMLRYGAGTIAVWGERSNGKTYSVKQYIKEQLYESLDNKFVYLRRRQRQITRRLMKKVFEDISDEYEETLGDVVHFSTESGFYILRDDQIVSIGWPMCVEDGTIGKGIPWTQVKTIMFEEFLEFDGEIEDEISKYLNIISTIVRKRDDVQIFMTANTIGGGKLSPYFQMLGIDPKKVKQGQRGFIKHENGATVAFHRTGTMGVQQGGIKERNRYVGFDNNQTVNMMLYGEWEYSLLNVKDVDSIGWNCNRRLLPFYVTGMGECYELSLYESVYPILFVRKVNNQNGMVKNDIRFNFSYDNSVILNNKKGRVPMFGKVNKLVDDECMLYWETVRLCLESQRVVFDTMENGSDFLNMLPHMV